MRNLNIIIDSNPSINDLFASDRVFTTIYICYQDKCFPDSKWNDFTNVILNTWLYNLLQVRHLGNHKFSLYFMDGPFRLDIFKDENMKLTIECVNARGVIEISEYTFVCDYVEILEALYDAFKSFAYMLSSKDAMIDKFESVFQQTIISMAELKEVIESR